MACVRRDGAPKTVFVRPISHSSGLVTEHGFICELQTRLDELEQSCSDDYPTSYEVPAYSSNGLFPSFSREFINYVDL